MIRCDKLYLDDVTECQGDLFSLASKLNLNSEYFINLYLKSDIRYFVDCGAAYYCTLSGKELLDSLGKKVNLNLLPRLKNPIDEDAMSWIGQFYSLCQWYSGLPSSHVVDYIPPRIIIGRYNTLHDMDIVTAVHKVLDSRGFMIYE